MTKKVTNNAHARETKPRITYSDEILATILDRVAKGEPLSKICDEPDMPTRKSFFQWVAKNSEIQVQYEFAMQLRADLYAEQTIEIADDGTRDTYKDSEGNERTDHDVIARSKLRVDARKWYASKLAPKKYGDKVAIGGADDLPPLKTMSDEALLAKIAELSKANDGEK